ncbi:hypothetical protein YQE_08604, partial [Dendroctonus ponderosae]
MSMDLLLGQKLADACFFVHSDIGVSSMDDQSKNNVVYELKTLANESNSTLLNEDHPVENLELPTDDTSLSINITSNLCRLCLENSPQMWNFFSIITLDDQSTIDVVVAFEKLTGEHVEEHENSRLPKHICQACLDLLVCAHLFKQKYEKSSTILKSLLTENCESVEIVKSEESCTEDNETGHESVLIPESTTDFSIAVDDIQELSDDDVASSPQPEIEPQSVRKRKREEGNQTFQHRCNICNRIFLGRNHLKFHQLSHKKESPYKCEECGKGFFRQANFDYHKLSHTMSDDLPFKCKYCAKSYSNPEALKRHTFHHENCLVPTKLTSTVADLGLYVMFVEKMCLIFHNIYNITLERRRQYLNVQTVESNSNTKTVYLGISTKHTLVYTNANIAQRRLQANGV